MEYYYYIALDISAVLFIIIAIIKKKPLLWILLFCLSLIPFIALFHGAIYSIFHGSGLVGDYGGIESGLFVIVIYFIYQWYIYLPSFILLIVSFYKSFIKKQKKINKKI